MIFAMTDVNKACFLEHIELKFDRTSYFPPGLLYFLKTSSHLVQDRRSLEGRYQLPSDIFP